MNTYIATFADGEVKRRTSKRGIYTHAWRVQFKAHINGDPVRRTAFGFSSSRDLAARAARAFASWDEFATREVIPVALN